MNSIPIYCASLINITAVGYLDCVYILRASSLDAIHVLSVVLSSYPLSTCACYILVATDESLLSFSRLAFD
jgi:hypothetical protein